MRSQEKAKSLRSKAYKCLRERSRCVQSALWDGCNSLLLLLDRDEAVRRGGVGYSRPFPAGPKEQILVPNLLLTVRLGQVMLLLQTPSSIIQTKPDDIIPKSLSISYMLGIACHKGAD